MKFEGLEPLIAKIDSLKELKTLANAIKTAAIYIRGKVATYPPATEANHPGGAGSQWYQRGWGSKWISKAEKPGGRQSSENLGKSWTIQTQNSGFRAIVGTDTSYAPWLQDQPRQTQWARARGWQTVQQVEDREQGAVEDFVFEALQREVNR